MYCDKICAQLFCRKKKSAERDFSSGRNRKASLRNKFPLVICSEKFTKCSLHSPSTGCIIVALYWLDYTIENSLASERRKWIDGMQRMRFV